MERYKPIFQEVRGNNFKKAADRKKQARKIEDNWTLNIPGIGVSTASTDRDNPEEFNVEYYSKLNPHGFPDERDPIWDKVARRNNMEFSHIFGKPRTSGEYTDLLVVFKK